MRFVALLLLVPSLAFAADAPPPPLYPGLGKTHHAVSTKNADAQKYFDQGLVLTYGFNHDEAYRAFEQASKLDPNCAMAYWGMALVLGPNINMPMDTTAEPRAYAHEQQALKLASAATPAERAYIRALAKRYAPKGSTDRSARDKAYSDAMRGVAKAYPDDADAQALFAESIMDLTPWDYWQRDGKPNPGTPELLATIEKALAKDPDHILAIHLYIHAVEASPDPFRAMPYAEKLPKLVPGAGHLVHMPSHLYRSAGRWEDSKELNQTAAEVDRKYIEAQKPTGIYPVAYYTHNMHFIAYAASMSGQSKVAIDAAKKMYENVPSDVVKQMSMAEMFTPYEMLVLARFGRWSEILTVPAQPAHYRYTNAIRHYVRGLALAATKHRDLAGQERDSLLAAIPGFADDYMVGFNNAKPLLRLAAQHLAAEIAWRDGRPLQAIPLLRGAVAMEDSLHYDEPPDWYAPMRPYLGAAYLEINKVAEAEAAYREDLKNNPNNGWSLFGLSQCLHSRDAGEERAKVDAELKEAWKNADVTLTQSRF